MRNAFTLSLAILLATLSVCPVWAGTGDLKTLLDRKITVPGHGETPYSWREVFMDITVGSVSYALPDFSSFALSSPALARGAAQSYFQHQRTIAYRNYERAMESGNLSDQRYYEGVIARLEAAVKWVSTGDGTDLRILLSKKDRQAAEEKDTGPPSTVSTGGRITATGPFTRGVPGVPYRDRVVTLTMGLDKNGTPSCRGVGYIKVSKKDEWIDYFFTLNPGKPLVSSPAKTYSSFPGSYRWQGNGTLEIRFGTMSWKGPVRWRAEVNGGVVTGHITDFFNSLVNKVPYDFLLAAIPEPLPFEAHFFDPSSGSGKIPSQERGGDHS